MLTINSILIKLLSDIYTVYTSKLILYTLGSPRGS